MGFRLGFRVSISVCVSLRIGIPRINNGAAFWVMIKRVTLVAGYRTRPCSGHSSKFPSSCQPSLHLHHFLASLLHLDHLVVGIEAGRVIGNPVRPGRRRIFTMGTLVGLGRLAPSRPSVRVRKGAHVVYRSGRKILGCGSASVGCEFALARCTIA